VLPLYTVLFVIRYFSSEIKKKNK